MTEAAQLQEEVQAAVPGIAVAFGFALFFLLTELALKKSPTGAWLIQGFKSNPKNKPEKIPKYVRQAFTNIGGAIHLAVAVPLAIYVMQQPETLRDRLHASTPASTVMIAFSAGYFMHDLFTCVRWFDEWGWPFLMHGLFCTILYTYGLITGHLHFYGGMFLLWELSTPFVYTRWFLDKLGYANGLAYKVNGILMILVFFLCRNVVGLACSVDFFRTTQAELRYPRADGLHPGAIWLYRVACICLNCLNAMWVFKMIQGAVKVFTAKPEQPKAVTD
jgi:hypothetical protein